MRKANVYRPSSCAMPLTARLPAQCRLPVRGLRSMATRRQVLIMTFAGSNLFSMLGYFLMDRSGAAEHGTGFVFTAMGLVSAGFQALLLGPLLHRFGEDRLVTFSMLLGAAGSAVLLAAPAIWVFMLGIIGTSGSMALIRPSVVTNKALPFRYEPTFRSKGLPWPRL